MEELHEANEVFEGLFNTEGMERIRFGISRDKAYLWFLIGWEKCLEKH